jgi:hypothetical protein
MGILAALLLTGGATGCYTYVPLASSPTPGSTVDLMLTDIGRVSLGQNIGQSARSIEADLQSVTDSGYVVGVRSVTYLNGQTSQWSNERLEIARQDVTNARERRFSRSRTIGVAAAAVGGIVAFIVTRSLITGGGADEPPPGGPPSEH